VAGRVGGVMVLGGAGLELAVADGAVAVVLDRVAVVAAVVLAHECFCQVVVGVVGVGHGGVDCSCLVYWLSYLALV